MYVHAIDFCPFLPTGNRLNCSTCILALHTETSEIALIWAQLTCSDVMPDHYLVQWVPEGSSTPVLTSDPITTSSNSYNITSLAPNTAYVISLLVVDVCGGMTAASLTARTNGECTGKRLFCICIYNICGLIYNCYASRSSLGMHLCMVNY